MVAYLEKGLAFFDTGECFQAIYFLERFRDEMMEKRPNVLAECFKKCYGNDDIIYKINTFINKIYVINFNPSLYL